MLVIFLAIGCSLGVQGLYDIYRETNSYSLEFEDKNTALKNEYTALDAEFDSLLGINELCLMMQIQDAGMPQPNRIVIDGVYFDIDTSRVDLADYVSIIKEVANESYRYLVRYDYITDSYYCTPYIKDTSTPSYDREGVAYVNVDSDHGVNMTNMSIDSNNITVENGTITFSANLQNKAVSFGNVLANGKTYLITFRAWSSIENDLLTVEAFPDDLPDTTFKLSTIPTYYSWQLEIPFAKEGLEEGDTEISPVECLRFLVSSEKNQGDIVVDNIEIFTKH